MTVTVRSFAKINLGLCIGAAREDVVAFAQSAGLANSSALFSEASATVHWSGEPDGARSVGPGIETVVTGGWTTRLEYRYSQFQQQQVLSGVGLQPSTHTIRAGLAYKFGIGSPSPSVASE